jgi:hypothetical protein
VGTTVGIALETSVGTTVGRALETAVVISIIIIIRNGVRNQQ